MSNIPTDKSIILIPVDYLTKMLTTNIPTKKPIADVSPQGYGFAFIFCGSGSTSFSESGSSCFKNATNLKIITLWKVFFSWKIPKRLLNHASLKNLNKLAIITNFLAFFVFIWKFFPAGRFQVVWTTPKTILKIIAVEYS